MSEVDAMCESPNIVVILADDMGFSDIGCYGGEIETPNLDRLAANGLRFTQFYNTARCCPTRASLLTGLYPHQAGVGILTDDSGPGLPRRPEPALRHHRRGAEAGRLPHLHDRQVARRVSNLTKPTDNWPLQRGFDGFYGTINGGGSFYDPNTLTRDNENIEHEAQADRGVLLHRRDQRPRRRVHPSSTHASSPAQAVLPVRRLHRAALAAARARRGHREVQGPLRRRLGRAARGAARASWSTSGSSIAHWKLTERDPTPAAVDRGRARRGVPRLDLRCMEVYAAQIDRMDQGIGRILAALEETGQLDNTLILFLADNGGCAEDIPRGRDRSTSWSTS